MIVTIQQTVKTAIDGTEGLRRLANMLSDSRIVAIDDEPVEAFCEQCGLPLTDTDGMTDYGGEDGTVYFCADCEIKEVQP